MEKTECRHGHPLTGANKYVSPKGVVVCRKCKRDAADRFNAKKKDVTAPRPRKGSTSKATCWYCDAVLVEDPVGHCWVHEESLLSRCKPGGKEFALSVQRAKERHMKKGTDTK